MAARAPWLRWPMRWAKRPSAGRSRRPMRWVDRSARTGCCWTRVAAPSWRWHRPPAWPGSAQMNERRRMRVWPPRVAPATCCAPRLTPASIGSRSGWAGRPRPMVGPACSPLSAFVSPMTPVPTLHRAAQRWLTCGESTLRDWIRGWGTSRWWWPRMSRIRCAARAARPPHTGRRRAPIQPPSRRSTLP